MDHRRRLLLRLARTGIAAVAGDTRVAAALEGMDGPCAVVSMGKAAGAMAAGAAQALGDGLVRGFIAQPRGYRWNAQPEGPSWSVYEGGHPLPDASSIEAGRALHDWLAALPGRLPLRVLMSGGASACVEWPADGVDLDALRVHTREWMAAGLDIQELNRRRGGLSRLKHGGALASCGTREVEVLVVSDVPGDDPAVVGGGPFVGPRRDGDTTVRTIATNADALHAIVDEAATLGVVVDAVDALAGDAPGRGGAIGDALVDAGPGLRLWGGETTVQLPDAPGRGGRCQALALAAAQRMSGHAGAVLLAIATDGVDGNGPDAGALVDGGTVLRIQDGDIDPADALARADAGTALEAAGDLVQTGPTGTNVMDLVLAYVSA